jgi:L-alanine-DL-glutamate epimerase-like enolase superfamily enzyme
MTLPNFLVMEFDRVPNPLRDELLVQPLVFKDGFFYLFDKPGLGIELDEEALKKFTMPF